MKLSQFTIFVPDFPSKGKYLVHNVFNQATAVIGERAREYLTNLQEPVADDERKYVDTFTELGLLVEDSVDESKEFRDWYEKSRYDKSAMRATILTTYDCNFACEYCVEEGVKKPVKMDDEHSDATVKWLIGKVEENQADKIQLLFYGGEPLMNVKPIYHIASEINDYAERNDISFDFNITTNGSLLRPELIDRLKPLGLEGLKITIDGDREAHNSKRPFNNGKGSFDVIIENILKVIDKVKIRIGANIDAENLESVPRMLDYLEEVGLKDKIDRINFYPIIHIQEQDGTSKVSKRANCAPGVGDWELDNLIAPTWDAFMRGFDTGSDEIRFTLCAMNRDGTVVVIDPLGRIYTCPAFVGREGFQVGDIYHQELLDRHRELMSIEVPDDCFKCAYMPLCSGGCKHVAYISHGDLSRTVCEKDYLQKVTAESLKMHVLSQKEQE